MILIDGKEGGGQILRTAVALSAILKEPIKVINIRGARCDGGLRPQHLMGVKIAGEFCSAEIKGLKIGSTEIEFIPRKLNVHDKIIDIGTAGSIPLLLQTLIPIVIFGGKHVELEIVGGTDTKWSPPIDYVRCVTLKNLEKMGVKCDIKILKRGFYPKGGGRIILKVDPVKNLNPFNAINRGKIKGVYVHSVCGSLPKHVAERQGRKALSVINMHYHKLGTFETSMSYEIVNSLSKGSSVTCYALCENSILGGNSLGELGKPAETVGSEAAHELMESLSCDATLDRYMADQILIYLAISKGKSRITVEKITHHCLTNIYVIENILPVEFQIKGEKDGFGEIRVKGVGLEF